MVSIWAKGGCISAKWFYLGKIVLLAKIGSSWAKVVLFGQELLVIGRNGSLWAKEVIF